MTDYLVRRNGKNCTFLSMGCINLFILAAYRQRTLGMLIEAISRHFSFVYKFDMKIRLITGEEKENMNDGKIIPH